MNHEDPEDPPRMQARALTGIMAVLLLALFVFVYQTYTQDLDLRRGDELFAQQRFEDALGYYLGAERRATGWLRARILYRIGATYERLDQCDRANDFFVKLLSEFPGSEWEERGKAGFLQCLRADVGSPGDVGEASQPLIAARKEMRRSYQRLVLLLRENRSGVPLDLEEAYRSYKLAYEAYVEQIQESLKALDRGGE